MSKTKTKLKGSGLGCLVRFIINLQRKVFFIKNKLVNIKFLIIKTFLCHLKPKNLSCYKNRWKTIPASCLEAQQLYKYVVYWEDKWQMKLIFNSGIFDLVPILSTSVNTVLKLTNGKLELLRTNSSIGIKSRWKET